MTYYARILNIYYLTNPIWAYEAIVVLFNNVFSTLEPNSNSPEI